MESDALASLSTCFIYLNNLLKIKMKIGILA